MSIVSRFDAQKNFDEWCDKSLEGPIAITRDGIPSAYLVSAEMFEEMSRSYRARKRIEDISENEMKAIAEAKVEPDGDYSIDDIPEIEVGKDPCRLTRERWTSIVANVHRYLRGEFIVEPMIRERRWEDLADFMRLLRNGPEPDLAMTDPSLFIAIRNAGTKAWLSGILHFKEPVLALTNDAEVEIVIAPRL